MITFVRLLFSICLGPVRVAPTIVLGASKWQRTTHCGVGRAGRKRPHDCTRCAPYSNLANLPVHRTPWHSLYSAHSRSERRYHSLAAALQPAVWAAWPPELRPFQTGPGARNACTFTEANSHCRPLQNDSHCEPCSLESVRLANDSHCKPLRTIHTTLTAELSADSQRSPVQLGHAFRGSARFGYGIVAAIRTVQAQHAVRAHRRRFKRLWKIAGSTSNSRFLNHSRIANSSPFRDLALFANRSLCPEIVVCASGARVT